MTQWIQFARKYFAAVVIALFLVTLVPNPSDAANRPKKQRSAKGGKSKKKVVARKKGKRYVSAKRRKGKGGKTRYVRSRKGKKGKMAYSRRYRKGMVKYVRYRRGKHGRRIRYVVYGYPRQSSAAYTAPVAPRVPPRVQIPEDRVREIQQALRSGGYYQGEITGEYDSATKDAMTNFQKANGIKETGMPTAQALMKLGLTKKTSPAGDTSAPGTPSPTPQKPPQPDNR